MKKTIILVSIWLSSIAHADENLLGYVRGAELIPKGHWEFYQIVTSRDHKGRGVYHAIDTATEVEYGVNDRLNLSASFQMQSLNTHGLVVNGYLPEDKSFNLKPAGFELYAKYNYLSPAKDDIGLSMLWSFNKAWVDPHSGQDKDVYKFESTLILQKYFLEGQLIWVGNASLEATHARRRPIQTLDPAVEWPTYAEMEIETKLGTGVSYRFIPNWFIGGESVYEVEYETDIDRERYTLFAGPSLHYGGEVWWATLTYFAQLRGGGEKYDNQEDQDLHLIEKTKSEIRAKIGFNF